jgi:hypothetical protein
MFKIRRSLIVIPALLFILACQAVTRPVQQVQDAGATAAAFATQAGEMATQVSGFATEIVPIQTFVPDLPGGNPLDPQSPPLSEWNGIPIMPQAGAGDESEGMYVFKVAATSEEIQEFYKTQLPNLGWEASFSIPAEGTAILLYSKNEQVLSITIMTSQGEDAIVMLNLQ